MRKVTTGTGKKRRAADALNGRSGTPAVFGSSPGDDRDDAFMNPRQLAYFRAKLIKWKNDIIADSQETIKHLQAAPGGLADVADRATSETQQAIELRARDRQRKLIAKIDAAIRRIHDGTYGYCEETGEPISLQRLNARPIATLSIDAQERHERREKIYRDE